MVFYVVGVVLLFCFYFSPPFKMNGILMNISDHSFPVKCDIDTGAEFFLC